MSMSRSEARLVRLALAQLALAALAVGVLALFFPRTFFDSFPFLTDWVDLLPPYNAHLTTDVGELQLAFGLLFAYAAARPTRALVVPVCLAWAASQLLHLAFHLAHLERFGTADAIAQTVTLAVVALVLPAAPVVLLLRRREVDPPPAR
jgi:hypothetical protein